MHGGCGPTGKLSNFQSGYNSLTYYLNVNTKTNLNKLNLT